MSHGGTFVGTNTGGKAASGEREREKNGQFDEWGSENNKTVQREKKDTQ